MWLVTFWVGVHDYSIFQFCREDGGSRLSETLLSTKYTIQCHNREEYTLNLLDGENSKSKNSLKKKKTKISLKFD